MRYNPYTEDVKPRAVANSHVAKASVEKLFDEKFVPQWQQDIDQAVADGLEHAVTVGVRTAWDKAATLSRQRILATHPSGGKGVPVINYS